MRKRPRLTYLLLCTSLILVCIFVGASCDENQNFVVKPAELCGCDVSEGPCYKVGESWKGTRDHLFEVSAVDFSNGGQIFKQCEVETGFWNTNKWKLVDGRKHNMAGTLHHFNWNYDDDEDWNLYVVPDPFFSFIMDDVKTMFDGDQFDCGGTPCMGNEISPDQALWTNPWFYKPHLHPQDTEGNGFSWLEGKQMGFYGPWVADIKHDYLPEIHPAEMMWWRDRHTGPGPYDVFWLFFMQDNTGRFDDEDNFDCGGSRPPTWKPWTHSPLAGQFNLAFEVDPTRETANFFIREHSKRFVVTSQDANARADADDGTSHGLQVNGRVVVNVEEQQPFDDDLGVTFTNMCMGSDGKLRGFVSIRSRIGGNDDRGEEGYHILYVTRSMTSARPDVSNPGVVTGNAAITLTANEIANSLGGVGDHFTGNLQLILHGNERATERDYQISKVEFAGNGGTRELKFEQNRAAKEVLVRDLPLIRDGKIVVTSVSGATSTLPVRGLSPLPSINETVTRSTVDAAAGRFLSAAVGGVAGVPLPDNKKLSALQELEVRFRPLYSLYEQDEASDTSSAFVNELNEALTKKDRRKLEQLFNSTEPFNLSWTFEATDLASGKTIPVSTPEAAVAGGGVQVQTTSTDWANDTLKIKFSSTGATGIVELRAKVSVTDKKGQTAVVEHRVWSHGFQAADKKVDGWLQLVQALSGVRDRSLFYGGDPVPIRKPKVFDIFPDRTSIRAQLIDGYLRDTLRDRQVTIAELRNVVRALKRFSAG